MKLDDIQVKAAIDRLRKPGESEEDVIVKAIGTADMLMQLHNQGYSVQAKRGGEVFNLRFT